MIFGKKNKRFIENNLAEMLALVGGAMEYCNTHEDLEGYEEYYIDNKKKDGFHYRSQKYADKIIRKELKDKGVHCKRKVSKRFYRYFERGSKKISVELYDYFKYVMDYILEREMLLKLALSEIFLKCKCSENIKKETCLDFVLDWQYKRVLNYATKLDMGNEKRKEKAKYLLDKLNKYSKFGKFQNECQIAHSNLSE